MTLSNNHWKFIMWWKVYYLKIFPDLLLAQMIVTSPLSDHHFIINPPLTEWDIKREKWLSQQLHDEVSLPNLLPYKSTVSRASSISLSTDCLGTQITEFGFCHFHVLTDSVSINLHGFFNQILVFCKLNCEICASMTE